jgi:hypothetical protein
VIPAPFFVSDTGNYANGVQRVDQVDHAPHDLDDAGGIDYLFDPSGSGAAW